MFGSRSSTTTRHRTGTTRQNRIRGLKAAVNNPRTTHSGRSGAQAQLISMGARPNKPTLGTRLRHFFHLPGKSHGRNRHGHAHTTHTTTTRY